MRYTLYITGNKTKIINRLHLTQLLALVRERSPEDADVIAEYLLEAPRIGEIYVSNNFGVQRIS